MTKKIEYFVIILCTLTGVLFWAYIILAPLMQQTVRVMLPKTSITPDNKQKNTIEVSVNKTHYFVVATTFKTTRKLSTLDQVKEIFEKYITQVPDSVVLVRADKNIGYGRVVKLMAVLQAAGAKSVGLVTEQAKTNQ